MTATKTGQFCWHLHPDRSRRIFTPSHAHHFLPLRSAVALVLLRPTERYVAAPAGTRSLRGRGDALGRNRDAVMPRSDGAALGEDGERGRTTCGPVSGGTAQCSSAPRGAFQVLSMELQVLVPSNTTLKFTSLWTGLQTSIKTCALSIIIE